MIYDISTLKAKYKNYKNINQKINIEVKKNRLTRIRRGLFSDSINKDSLSIANICYEPSYVSFEYALSYYGLIPEKVTLITSACFGKKNNKFYKNDIVSFEYRSIPNAAFPYGINYMKNENGIKYKIASKEKALCDTLYSKYPVRTLTDLKILLFVDLRIDENEFIKLNFEFIKDIIPLYHSNTLNTLIKYYKEVIDGINN